MRHPQLLHADRAGLLVIDIQEKFVPVIFKADKMIENTAKLIQAFTILERPVIITEQYPKGLGNTVDAIASLLPEFQPLEKFSFSCCEIPNFNRMLREKHIHQIVLCGIETHVCLWQTAMDLQHGGFEVTVVEDAVSSRHLQNKQSAILRLRTEGIHITSLEMILFELLETAGHSHFKEIQALIK